MSFDVGHPVLCVVVSKLAFYEIVFINNLKKKVILYKKFCFKKK